MQIAMWNRSMTYLNLILLVVLLALIVVLVISLYYVITPAHLQGRPEDNFFQPLAPWKVFIFNLCKQCTLCVASSKKFSARAKLRGSNGGSEERVICRHAARVVQLRWILARNSAPPGAANFQLLDIRPWERCRRKRAVVEQIGGKENACKWNWMFLLRGYNST